MFKRLHNKVQNLSNREVLGILIVVAVASVISSALNGASLDTNWWANVSQGLVTEMAGAAATFWLINLIFEGRRKREEEEQALEREKVKQAEGLLQEKARLIRQMCSSINEETIRAVEQLRAHTWFEDGSLQGANLVGANLSGADLKYINLQGAKLQNANLQEAQLGAGNLQEVNLENANLQGADLRLANLQGANLRSASLQGAELNLANLHMADFGIPQKTLDDPILTKFAELGKTKLDETTTLPDSSKWTPETDLRRFTDQSHPHFWRSDNSFSPAYRGKTES